MGATVHLSMSCCYIMFLGFHESSRPCFKAGEIQLSVAWPVQALHSGKPLQAIRPSCWSLGRRVCLSGERGGAGKVGLIEIGKEELGQRFGRMERRGRDRAKGVNIHQCRVESGRGNKERDEEETAKRARSQGQCFQGCLVSRVSDVGYFQQLKRKMSTQH